MKKIFPLLFVVFGINNTHAQNYFSENFESGTLGAFTNSGTITALI